MVASYSVLRFGHVNQKKKQKKRKRQSSKNRNVCEKGDERVPITLAIPLLA